MTYFIRDMGCDLKEFDRILNLVRKHNGDLSRIGEELF